MPMESASPRSWRESDRMATELTNKPPKNSKIENDRFSIKAMRIFLSVFNAAPYLRNLTSLSMAFWVFSLELKALNRT